MKKSLLILLLLFSNLGLFASNYYWVGGSGDWSDINHWVTTSGGIVHHIQTPTANDNVIFDANSSTAPLLLNLNSQTIICKEFNVENIAHALIFSGICQTWKIYGGMKLSPLFDFSNTTLYFEALAGNHFIKTNAKVISPDIHFKGTANWKLQDYLRCNNIFLESGNLYTNSNDITASGFVSNGVAARSIDLGSSTVEVTKWIVSGSAYSVNCGTSHIYLRGFNSSFRHDGVGNQSYYNLTFTKKAFLLSTNMVTTFHNVYFISDGGISGSNIYDSLYFSFGGTYTIGSNSTQTFNQGLYAEGDCKDYISIRSGNGFTTFIKANGTVNCNYSILEHIHASGGASFMAQGSVDMGDNIGWQMQAPPMRTLYWVGDSGYWGDTLHWSATSGGIGGECIPTLVDNVIFDHNSYSNTASVKNNVKLNVLAQCHDFTWQTGLVGKLKFNKDLQISGSSFFGADFTLSPGKMFYVSDDLGETIETSNIELGSIRLEFTGGGSWQLLDSLKNTEGLILHSNGHLKTLGKYVSCNNFESTNLVPKELSFGNSTIDVQSSFVLEQDSLTVHTNTSYIRMLGDTATVNTFGANPAQLYNLDFVPETGRGTNFNLFTSFNKIRYFQNMTLIGVAISDTLYYHIGKDYEFNIRTDSVVRFLSALGNCNHTISMRDRTALKHFYIKMGTFASLSVSDLHLRGSVITGPSIYNAINSSNLGMNSGWVFPSNGVNHYWVNGEGNWQDSSHWSYSSGGQSGACIPKIYDDVFFDGNSFSTDSLKVIIDTMNIYCRDMSWTNATNQPQFFNESKYVFYQSGSLELIKNMRFHNEGETFFVWTQNNKTINLDGQQFENNITFCDSGQWTLLDTLSVLKTIIHDKGKLNANQFLIQTGFYKGNSMNAKTLDIHNSEFHIRAMAKGFFKWREQQNTHLIANGSHIRFLYEGQLKTEGAGLTTFNNVSFMNKNGLGEVIHLSILDNYFNRLFFQNDGHIYGKNTYDTLVFSKEGDYHFEAGFDQFIIHKWIADADCYGMINITGMSLSPLGTASTVHQLNGNVLMHSVNLHNLNAVGTASFTIIDGNDLGGNSSNWQIIPKVARTLYWVNAGGDWFDTTHWSLSSAGLGGECIPTYIDDVYFDTASFHNTGDIAFANATTTCHDLIWKWTPLNPEMNINELNIYGSVSLGDTMKTNLPVFNMMALDSNNFIRTSAHKIKNVKFLTDGAWYLADDLFLSKGIGHYRGSFFTNAYDIYAQYYTSSTNFNRAINISNSKLNLSLLMNLNSESLNLVANNSEVNFDANTGSLSLSVSGTQSLHFHNVTFLPVNKLHSIVRNTTSQKQYFDKLEINNSAQIYGVNEIDSLIFRAGNTYELEKGITQYVNDYWFVRGNNCNALNLQSTVKNQQAIVSKTSGVVSGDFINLRDVSALGGATFYAGQYSTDVSNNSGWTFSNGPQYVYGLGPDTSFTLGSTITITTANFNGGPNTTYLWSNGSTSANITVSQTGWYYVSVTFTGGCTVVDSIYVGCDLQMNYNITNNICNGDSLGVIQSLIPDSNYDYTFNWNTGDTTSFIDSLAAGSYHVIVSADSGLCTVVDTLQISEPPPVICPQGDTAYCIEDSVELDLGYFISYSWNDNYQGQYRWVSHADTFIISVEDKDGCWSVPDSISVREDLPPIVELGNDTTICLNESVLLEAGAGFDEYLWSENSALSNIRVYYTGVYWVRVREKTCVVSDTIELFNCPPLFIVPNVFTPNGDGVNDVFNIDYQNIWEFEVRIYDRWGTKVFQSTDLLNPWDGRVNGRESAEGVYFWQIIYQEYNGQGGGYEDKIQRGTLTLIRGE